uniref:Uncharacterized protein n=1 Tax=Caenorhabditis tropicalis TaxID=1561998 RepID=A0A1I7T7T5_9PELO
MNLIILLFFFITPTENQSTPKLECYWLSENCCNPAAINYLNSKFKRWKTLESLRESLYQKSLDDAGLCVKPTTLKTTTKGRVPLD